MPRIAEDQYADCDHCGERYWGRDADRCLTSTHTKDLCSDCLAEENTRTENLATYSRTYPTK